MEAIPGRVTVHIWSRVRSVRDCEEKGEVSSYHLRKTRRSTHIHWRNDVVAVVAAKSSAVRSTGGDLNGFGDWGGSSSGRRRDAMAHNEEGVEAEGDVHDELQGQQVNSSMQ